MLERIIGFSVSHRGLVLLLTVVLLVAGSWAAWRLHVDAVPDITSAQVQINTVVPALAPEEIEQLVTFPLESRMAGLPGMTELRSLSRPGLSQITMTFEDDADIYRLRQLAAERLTEVVDELPSGARPALAPVSTGLGEVFYYAVEYAASADLPPDDYDRLAGLWEIQEYTIKPRLRATPGLAEVNTSGGFMKTFFIEPDPGRLTELNLTFGELAERLRGNWENAGGGLLEVGGEQVVVRSNLRLTDVDELARLPLKFGAGAEPILLGDVARIRQGSPIRTGASTVNGREAVLGAAIMRSGENSRVVADAVGQRLAEIQEGLPEGVVIRPLYDRSELIEATIATVRRNLIHGALLVSVVLFLMLWSIRAALIVVAVIPLSMLVAFIGMSAAGVSGNLMSLGAIDFGLVVSGAVIVVENCLRRTGARGGKAHGRMLPEERLEEVRAAAAQVARPVFFGVSIITLVYVPILALTGIEGKMFRPMALTVIFALAGSLVLALTFAPALASLFLTESGRRTESWLVRAARRGYGPILRTSLRAPVLVVLAAAVVFSGAVVSFSRMGAEFIPQLDEGSIAIQMIRSNSVGIQTSLDLQQRAERLLLREFPEIRHVFSRIGTAEIATDPMGPNVADTYVLLHPPETWRMIDGRRARKEDLVRKMQRVLENNVPGQSILFSQPIQLRFNEIMAGARADIAVRIFGDDFETLENLAFAARDILREIPGGGDVEFDAMGRVPMLEILPDREAMRRLNQGAGELNRTVATALAGEEVGRFIVGNRYYPVSVRLAEDQRHDPDALTRLPVRGSDGGLIALGEVASVRVEDRVANITRETGSRRVAILINLRGRDLQGFATEARRRLRDSLSLPDGYSFDIGGQFENYTRARERLAIVVPATLAMIFILIHLSIGSIRQTLITFVSIPFAVTGGVFALWIREMPFSISAGVGFIALSGIAVLDALVLVNCFNDMRREHASLQDAVVSGAMIRLRPVLMTSVTASLGFLPMALATTLGAEVQRPIATVVIGGIVSSTVLTLFVLPGLYMMVESWWARTRGQPEN